MLIEFSGIDVEEFDEAEEELEDKRKTFEPFSGREFDSS